MNPMIVRLASLKQLFQTSCLLEAVEVTNMHGRMSVRAYLSQYLQVCRSTTVILPLKAHACVVLTLCISI